MSPTLDYRLKGAFSLLTNNPDNPCLLNVLTFLILHKNSRGRCWISTELIAQSATRGDPNKAVHAKQWLIEHDAIKLVPYEKRSGDEIHLPKRQHIFQLTGYIRDGDTIYPYLYLSDTDLEEFKKAAEDVAGDIINQVHAKPKVKRVRNRQFIAHKSSSVNIVNSSKPESEISDVHIIDVPNLSISNLSRYSTTYQNFQNTENSGTQNADNSQITQQNLIGSSQSGPSSIAASLDIINNSSIAANTYSEGGELTSRLLQNNKIHEHPKINVFVDNKGEAIIDPSLILVAPNGQVTYICPSCRSYVTEEPNQICKKCFNAGVHVDIQTMTALAENVDTITGKYPKEVKQQVRAVQFAILRTWPGMSQAYGWAGKVAQMLVGVSPKKDKEFFTHRLRTAATPEEVGEFARWWNKTKLDNHHRPIDLPSSAEALEKFFSEFRNYVADEQKRRQAGQRKYIEIDLSEYK